MHSEHLHLFSAFLLTKDHWMTFTYDARVCVHACNYKGIVVSKYKYNTKKKRKEECYSGSVVSSHSKSPSRMFFKISQSFERSFVLDFGSGVWSERKLQIANATMVEASTEEERTHISLLARKATVFMRFFIPSVDKSMVYGYKD